MSKNQPRLLCEPRCSPETTGDTGVCRTSPDRQRVVGALAATSRTLIALTLGLAVTAATFAGEYVQTQGEGYRVCGVVGDHLKKLGPLNQPPSCSGRVVAGLKGVSHPQWEAIDIDQHRDLLVQLPDQGLGRTPLSPEERARWLENIKQLGATGDVKFEIARIDLNRDGVQDIVLRQRYPKYCEENGVSYPTSGLFILTPDGRAVDQRRMSKANITSTTDLVVFGGRPYTLRVPGSSEVFVGEERSYGHLAICTFEFVEKGATKGSNK